MHKVIDDLNWRYATKKFDTNKSVSDHDIDVLKESARLTATSYGLQMMKLLVIKNQEIMNKLWPHSYNQNQIKDASHILVLANRTNITNEDIDEYLKMSGKQRDVNKEGLENYGNAIKADLLNRSSEAINIWSKNQCYIALGNLLNVCAQLRIDSCPMEGFSPKEYNTILDLDGQHLNACLVLPIGYRSEEDTNQHNTKLRKEAKDFFIEL